MTRLKTEVIKMRNIIKIESVEKIVKGRKGRDVIRVKTRNDGKKRVVMQFKCPLFRREATKMGYEDKRMKDSHLIFS